MRCGKAQKGLKIKWKEGHRVIENSMSGHQRRRVEERWRNTCLQTMVKQVGGHAEDQCFTSASGVSDGIINVAGW